MFKKKIVSVALSSLLLASPLAMAVDEHHPEQASEASQDNPVVENRPADTPAVTDSPMQPGMMSMGQGTGQSSGGMMMGGPGMMMGSPGMMGNRGGMMRQMMMGNQKGSDAQSGMMGSGMMQGNSGPMGQGGMMSQGMKGGHGHGMGHGMMQKHQQLVSRLDLLDARMAKIEAMLERLLQR